MSIKHEKLRLFRTFAENYQDYEIFIDSCQHIAAISSL